jgi:hypothetical protein
MYEYSKEDMIAGMEVVEAAIAKTRRPTMGNATADAALDALREEVQALTKRVKALESWREAVTVARAAARRADNAGDNANDNAITRAAKNQRAYRARKKGASDAVQGQGRQREGQGEVKRKECLNAQRR